jgi:hypothetical protein
MVHGIEFSKLQTIGSWVWSLENHWPHEIAIIGARPQSSDKPTSSRAQTHHPHITPAGDIPINIAIVAGRHPHVMVVLWSIYVVSA